MLGQDSWNVPRESVHIGDGEAWLSSGYQGWSTAPGKEPQVGAITTSLLPQGSRFFGAGNYLGWEQGQGPEPPVSRLWRWRGRQGTTSEFTVRGLEETQGFLSCLPCPKAQPALTKLLLTDACLTLSLVSTAPSLCFLCSDLFQDFPLLRELSPISTWNLSCCSVGPLLLGHTGKKVCPRSSVFSLIFIAEFNEFKDNIHIPTTVFCLSLGGALARASTGPRPPLYISQSSLPTPFFMTWTVSSGSHPFPL